MMDSTRGIGFSPNNSPALPQGKKIVLGIGINAYEEKGWPPLRNAVGDMKAVVELLLKKYDFDSAKTLIDQNATKDNIENELYRFTSSSMLGPHDTLLIYYSGHGHLDENGRGYWVPVDVEKDNIATYLANSRIRELVADLKCRHLLLVSDACFSGSFFELGIRGSAANDVAEEYEKRISRWAFCSGRHNQAVSDGKPNEHSPFAGAILEELSINDREKLNFARLADKVIEITRSNYRQMPEANPIHDAGHKGGQLVFSLRNAQKQEGKLTEVQYKQPLVETVRGSDFNSAQSETQTLKKGLSKRALLVSGAVLLMLLLGLIIANGLGWFDDHQTQMTTLEADPKLLDFDTLDVGVTNYVTVKVKNTGLLTAELDSLSFSSQELSLDLNPKTRLLPGQVKTFKCKWVPQNTGTQIYYVQFLSPQLAQPLRIQIAGFVRPPENPVDPPKSVPDSEPNKYARIVATKSLIDFGEVKGGMPVSVKFTLKNTGNVVSPKLELKSMCNNQPRGTDFLDAIAPNTSKTYTQTWYPEDSPGAKQCTLQIVGHNAMIIVKGKVAASTGGGVGVSPPPTTFVVTTDIPPDVKMWLQSDSGTRYDAVNGSFKLPLSLKNKSARVFFKRNDKEDWIRIRIGSDPINLPAGF